MIDLTSFSTIVIIVVILYLISSIKILREYERGVIFRLGRLLPQPKGPGIILVFAPLDRIVRVSLRVDTLEVPAQDVITRDNVTVKVNAVIYFRVVEPRLAVVEVSNFLYATSQLAQTTLRSVLGEVELDELLSQREKLNMRLQSILDQHTSPWGVKVTMVEVKQVDLAEQMIRAIARQAEAERERRAKIIHAEGEYTAAEKLAMAAEVIQKQPAAMQLRYLQTLVEIGVGKEHHHRVPAATRYNVKSGARAGPLRKRRRRGGQDVNHAKQRNRRIRTGGGQPATAERVFYYRAAVRGGVRDGLRGGAELAAVEQAGDHDGGHAGTGALSRAGYGAAGGGVACGRGNRAARGQPGGQRATTRRQRRRGAGGGKRRRECGRGSAGGIRRSGETGAAPALAAGSYWQAIAVPQADAEVIASSLKEKGFPSC